MLDLNEWCDFFQEKLKMVCCRSIINAVHSYFSCLFPNPSELSNHNSNELDVAACNIIVVGKY
jgi:hypothetical protein